ncbi:hypothetical protein CcI6DRAFT_04614 [Frankia sp. CcI6]|uniref:restriction endonuclease subunit S n=1 Tax=unclassified Frankia TaxID=2632575 RepID=UPI0003D02D7F|nr:MULTISPECIES: restriction endonuclease subunit S [unclassified Frankia]ESZ99980.1 hypothetical protein CcI6DRAFT_04614 [Frankia sp. CcI6]KFB06240.1 restriction endonuclease S subunit [Frankia sp. Allo2]
MTVEPGVEYRAVSVLKDGQGLGPKNSFVGGETNYSTLYRVRTADVVLRTITAFESPVGVATSTHDGAHVSGVFLTYEVARDLLPEYLRLVFQTPRFWGEMQARATGTVLRRKTVNDTSFAAIPIRVPPLDEQRRIVDLVSSVDATIAGLASEALQGEGLGSALAEDLLRDVERVPADRHIVKIDGGKSPQTTNVAPTASEEGVLKVSAVTPFEFLPGESKALLLDTALPFSSRVRPGDVLITRANTPQKVGAVCRVPEDVRGGLFLSDKTLRLTPGPDLDPDFLVVAMSLASARDHLTGSATGTSASMFNISQSKIRATPIPVPERSAQQRIAATVMSARQVAREVWREHERTLTLRASLLTSLLTQETEIAEAYDRFLGEVA